jgi:hypothetical protein
MGSPLLTAVFSPLNIAMFVLVILAGLFSAWWLFPLGVILWLIMVINAARQQE